MSRRQRPDMQRERTGSGGLGPYGRLPHAVDDIVGDDDGLDALQCRNLVHQVQHDFFQNSP